MFPQCPCHCWQIILSHSFSIQVLLASYLCGPDRKRSLSQFQPVSKLEIEEILSNLVLNKLPGPDGISPFELKLVARKISGTLAILYNESLATGEIPVDFEVGHII